MELEVSFKSLETEILSKSQIGSWDSNLLL